MFLRECIFGPFCSFYFLDMLDAWYYYIFLVVPYVSERVYLLAPFCFTFSLLSLSLCYFLYLQLDLCMLVQVKQIGWVLRSFYYKNKGKERLAQRVGRG